VLSVVLLLQTTVWNSLSNDVVSTTSLAVFKSILLRHSYSVRHLDVVCSHDRNLSLSVCGVFDILALYKPDYYYYYYYYTDAARIIKLDIQMFHDESWKPIYFEVKRSQV